MTGDFSVLSIYFPSKRSITCILETEGIWPIGFAVEGTDSHSTRVVFDSTLIGDFTGAQQNNYRSDFGDFLSCLSSHHHPPATAGAYRTLIGAIFHSCCFSFPYQPVREPTY